MTLIGSFQDSTLFNKLSFMFSFLATLFCWVSYVMPAWGYDTDPDNSGYSGYGMWRRCKESSASSGCQDLTGWNLAWYGVTQAFVTLGFVGVNLAFVLIVLQIFVGKCQKVKEIAFWNFLQCILTSVCYLIGIIIFAAKFDNSFRLDPDVKQELGYSWALAVVALVVNGIAVSVLQFLEGKDAIKD